VSAFKHPPSHLDIESPLFENRPHIWIQWKGTDVCCDIHCDCGYQGHFDGEFLYAFRCPKCQQVWEVGTHMPIYKRGADYTGVVQDISGFDDDDEPAQEAPK
jgi:hypothetical protein